jgi:hypothetical protein
MTALLTAFVIWLSANFDLPAIRDHPKVERVPAVRMVALHYRGLATDRVSQPAIAEHAGYAPLDAAKNIVALYDREKKIIYPQEG